MFLLTCQVYTTILTNEIAYTNPNLKFKAYDVVYVNAFIEYI